MKSKVYFNVFELIGAIILFVSIPCKCQSGPAQPFSANNFGQLIRTTMPAPKGRIPNVRDIYLRYYSENSTKPSTVRLRSMRKLHHPSMDFSRPTVVYAHGYVELTTDRSVQTVVSAYLRRGTHNVFALDWANMAFGNYVTVATDIPAVAKETAVAMLYLLGQGMPASSLHFVGHSLGAHLLAEVARHLATAGHRIQRLTALDPANPGYYPPLPLLGRPMSPSDAVFVDAIHSDAGWFGAAARVAHADFWPNGGAAKQPGCNSVTVPFSNEDFCSHWRSWAFWAESVERDAFLARQCTNYDAFLRGQCRENPLVHMGLNASPDLRGNFYLRTAAKIPYGLGGKGAE